MKQSPFSSTSLFAFSVLAVALSNSACQKKKPHVPVDVLPQYFQQSGVCEELLKDNRMQGLQGGVYANQVHSPIHWQPWTKETLDNAKKAKRLLFCVVAMPRDLGFEKVLNDLAKDSQVVATINDKYVPVLVDGSAVREVGLLTAELSAEIKKPISFPFFMWMTHEGNPVGWVPAVERPGTPVAALFDQSHNMVYTQWMSDPMYILKNSQLDNNNRKERMVKRYHERALSVTPEADVAKSVRQLISLYDPVTRTFDETGALVPAGAMQLLALAAVNPSMPAELRQSAKSITEDLLNDLLPSPMFDPIEGGVFLVRRAKSWALPVFTRDCPGQVQIAEALFDGYRATKNRRALQLASRILLFAESEYQTKEGLFAVGKPEDLDPKKWMWTVADIRKQLSSEDAELWIKATKMTELGNLPSEADPKRDLFRYNAISIDRSVQDLAKDAGQSYEEFAPRYRAILNKLNGVRRERLGKSEKDELPHAESSLRMVSSYAAAYSAMGQPMYREKAVELLVKIKQHFGKENGLSLYPGEVHTTLNGGRAHLYALAMQAALDVESITGDAHWVEWAGDLLKVSHEQFDKDGVIEECNADAKVIDVPVVDTVMLFGDSTVGLMSLNENRLAAKGIKMNEVVQTFVTGVPERIAKQPVMYTDLLAAMMCRYYAQVIVYDQGVSAELKEAVMRLDPQSVLKKVAGAEDQVAPGKVKVLIGNQVHEVATVAELHQLCAPGLEYKAG